MKNSVFISFVLVFVLITNMLIAQNVAISDDGNYTAHNSAMLDVKSTSKGLLIPRLTKVQRDNILSPATGLLLFQTDSTPGFYFYNGGELKSTWEYLSSSMDDLWKRDDVNGYTYLSNNTDAVGIGTSSPDATLHVEGSIKMADGNQGAGKILISDAGGVASWNDASSINDMDWIVSGTNMYSAVSGNIGIGTTSPGPNYKMEIYNPSGLALDLTTGKSAYARIRLQSMVPDEYFIIDGNWGGLRLSSPQDIFMFTGTGRKFELMNGNFIVNNGNVGIGLTNPSSKLEVAGNVDADGFTINGVPIGTSTSSYWSASGSNIYYNSSKVGIGTANPQNPLSVERSLMGGGIPAGVKIKGYRNSLKPWSYLRLGKSRGNLVGQDLTTQPSDTLGVIEGFGIGGQIMGYPEGVAGQIIFRQEGEVMPQDIFVPGSIIFTTCDGAGQVSERMKIHSNGEVEMQDDVSIWGELNMNG